jgi:ketosteroid isomerase-like protein
MPSNAELLTTAYDAWNRDDCDAWLELLDPQVEIHTSGVFPDFAPVYRGHDQARSFWRRLREPWTDFRIEVERMQEDEDTATAAVRFRAKGVDSGVEVDMRFCNSIRVRDGLAIALVNRRTPEEAYEALCELELPPASEPRRSRSPRSARP